MNESIVPDLKYRNLIRIPGNLTASQVLRVIQHHDENCIVTSAQFSNGLYYDLVQSPQGIEVLSNFAIVKDLKSPDSLFFIH